ncbi:excinuclease ABC, A subunit [Chloroherpeton thalassium ATCC 35110]|uniref:UvrABC system protein A n=1 Tax=Chloroherpeton thalassium (strain ATCC 35110 / GB-78) TaxID=517418 RepID=B3QT58_CHLT3|nr:excinuclease ABC subunit UvrA [Chloroherpeton thalassium]ACF14157.1 excinuclease ABC, A subunit [Chloroherpeton thalassium ATCC 35110]
MSQSSKPNHQNEPISLQNENPPVQKQAASLAEMPSEDSEKENSQFVSRHSGVFIKGARTHNLKNIDVAIPRNKLVVISGVSGSGKSSLAFDTLYAEGHRRYVESMSSYIRQFLERIPKPDVDFIQGIAPAIAIEQKTTSKNPRSTVGTVTEIYDYLRLLFARIGKTYSKDTNELVLKHTPEDVLFQVKLFEERTKFYIGFPFPHHKLAKKKERSFSDELQNLKQKGFTRIVKGETIFDLSSEQDENKLTKLNKSEQSELLVLTDRLAYREDEELFHRVTEAVETCFRESGGYATVRVLGGRDYQFSDKLELNGIEYEEPTPQLFAFNSPVGACPTCQGFGRIPGVDEDAVVPNKALSIRDGAIACWNSDKHSRHLRDLIRVASEHKIPLDEPYGSLSENAKKIIWQGAKNSDFLGVKGFFKEIEREAQYKMHYRVLLSRYRGYTVCPDCQGTRLRKDALQVRVAKMTLADIVEMTIGEAYQFFKNIEISRFDKAVASTILEEILRRLSYLVEVGLDYLTLSRPSQTLSGGESQRINLATSLGSSLVGSLYILDEPSIGLHQRDSARLIRILRKLRDIGNTVIVVEHDREIIEAADIILDLGPKAGRHGGELIFHGTYEDILQSASSVTGKYLTGKNIIPLPEKRREPDFSRAIEVQGAMENNLKNLDVKFPLGVMTCVTGVSGSGKSTLVTDILYLGLLKQKVGTAEKVGTHKALLGGEQISKIELVDQSPIGRTSRSNPATYLKIFDEIRSIFAHTTYAKAKGWEPGYFSFNIPGGRCETCAGEGVIHIEMQFLADIETVCEDCHGRRYKAETLSALYNGKSIADVLDMTVTEAIEFFQDHRALSRKLSILEDVGLGYLQLGQSASTLSGGEAQRLKLALHISSIESRNALFIFDEPTTGLHFDDIQKLIQCFNQLLAQGNTLIIIEHNLDVIKQADWIIDLGPDAGNRGGEIVAAGVPESIAAAEASFTGKYLKEYLI